MSQVRVRQKHQITLPAKIVLDAHITPNDTLEAAFVNGVITLTPKKRQEQKNSVMAFAGIAKGVWGDTPEAVEETLRNQRESWER
jgi:antitoxin component of MazEF toxin-antitoxin module